MKRFIVAALGLLASMGGVRAEELVYWSVWAEPEPQAVALKQIFSNYEKAHPGVTVKPVWSGRQSLVLMRSYLAAGNKVDVIDGDARQYLGLMLKEDLSLNLAGLNTELAGKTLPNTLSTMAKADVQYGIPYIYNAVVFLYSKAAFAKAAIEHPPKTLDELFSACGALKKAGFTPIAVEGNLDFFSFYYATYLLDQLAGRDYIRTLVEDRTGEGWKSDKVRQMLVLARKFWETGCIPDDAKSNQWPTAQQNIAAGTTAMELIGSWLPTELANAVEPGFQWGAFPFPHVAGGINSDDLNTAMMTIGVYKESSHPDMATDLVRFIMSDESQQQLAKDAAVGVVRSKPTWVDSLAEVKTIAEAAPASIVEDGVSAYYPDYGAHVMLPTFGKYFTGQISADEYVAQMVSATKDYWANKK